MQMRVMARHLSLSRVLAVMISQQYCHQPFICIESGRLSDGAEISSDSFLRYKINEFAYVKKKMRERSYNDGRLQCGLV